MDPRTLTREQKVGYLANLERCKAQQLIHLRKYNPTDRQDVYELFARAYGDEAMARKAQAQAAEAYAEQCCAEARAGKR